MWDTGTAIHNGDLMYRCRALRLCVYLSFSPNTTGMPFRFFCTRCSSPKSFPYAINLSYLLWQFFKLNSRNCMQHAWSRRETTTMYSDGTLMAAEQWASSSINATNGCAHAHRMSTYVEITFCFLCCVRQEPRTIASSRRFHIICTRLCGENNGNVSIGHKIINCDTHFPGNRARRTEMSVPCDIMCNRFATKHKPFPV